MQLTRIALGALGLAVLCAPSASAQCPAADAFEPNDDCLTATPVTPGSYPGLTIDGPAIGENQDFFTISVNNGDILTVDLTFLNANGDVDLYLYDTTTPACGGTAAGDYLIRGFTASDNESVSWANSTGAAETYTIMVDFYDLSTTSPCNDYDLTVSVAPDPCAGSDDGLEDNDDCASAVAMVDGTTAGLFVSKTDDDYYEVQVADGDTLTVDILFSDALGDLDLELYLDNADCVADINVAGSFSTTDNESVSYTNTSGGVLTMYVHVYHWASDTTSDCNNYDLVITGSGGSAATPFCPGDGSAGACPCGNESAVGAGEGCNSSLGFGAILTAAGSASVANDDMVFTLSQARPNQPSLLVQGTTSIAVPFKDGLLCMGNPTERLEVVFLDATGTGSTTVSIVTEGAVSPGDTRYYQQWFRDPGGVSPCGSGSNFSGGLIVVWM